MVKGCVCGIQLLLCEKSGSSSELVVTTGPLSTRSLADPITEDPKGNLKVIFMNTDDIENSSTRYYLSFFSWRIVSRYNKKNMKCSVLKFWWSN